MDVDAESCESCIEPDAKPRGDEQPEKNRKPRVTSFDLGGM